MTETAPLVTILDDEPAIRTMLAQTLEEAGFRTLTFARATEFERRAAHPLSRYLPRRPLAARP